MDLTRREFLAAGAAAGCAALCGCATLNPAPTYDAAPDGTLPLPTELEQEGAQVKVRLPGVDDTLLVWRTGTTLAAASVLCTHLGCEVTYAPAANTLDCPCHGSRFRTDGSVLRGPARRPLRTYRATLRGETLHLESAP